MHDLETIVRLNNPDKRTQWAKQRDARNVREGWVEYPHKLTAQGGFVERLNTIAALIGSTQYEYKIENKVYVRRVED